MVALWATGQRLQTRLAELEAKRQEPVKDARNSSEDDQWCLTPFSLFHATPMLGEEFRNG